MPDREKVIKGLECCSNPLDYQLRCNGCPYYSDCQSWNEDWISFKLIADALELLKEQETTKEEKNDAKK